MFGIVRPCRHRLSAGLRTEWLAHLCGLCLTLRGEHGQFARLVTNYDALLVSALYDAQREPAAVARRTAGPCPLRAMRTAPVARGEGARLAASVSLVLAAAKIRDHAADGDGLLARRTAAGAARRIARAWDGAGARGGAAVGFDTAVLVDAVERQPAAEAAAGPGSELLLITDPTETATAAAFAHTAHLAGRPENAAPLAEAGRLFGRLAHLLDAVDDLAADRAAGAFNPIIATGREPAEVRRLCDDAARGIALALRDVRCTDRRLVHRLLVHEVRQAVDRSFGGSCAHLTRPAPADRTDEAARTDPADEAAWADRADRTARQGRRPAGHRDAPGSGAPPRRGRRRGLLAGCAVWTGLLCSCRLCCASTFHDPWTGEEREGLCHKGDCSDCGGCCDCCSCCGGEDGGCGCDCDCCDC